MSYYTSPAMEGIFDPEATTSSLLANAKANIEKKVTTIAEAVDLEDRLSAEAAQFNTALSTISDAMRRCQSGEISREDALAQARPCVADLKERCTALNLTGISISESDITENEIAMLREYIVGCKDIVAKHKQYLQDHCEEEGCESFLDIYNEESDDYLAEESLKEKRNPTVTYQIQHSTDANNAAMYFKQARKLYSIGSKDKANDYMKRAKALYQKLLAEVKAAGDENKIERSTTVKNGGMKVTDTDKRYSVYKDKRYAKLVALYEDRIDECEAHLRQWANKAGNASLQDTKDILKQERKREKRSLRDAKAGRDYAKESTSEDNEEYEIGDESELDFDEVELTIAALESYMDDMSIELDFAMEASGDSSSNYGQQLRSDFTQLTAAVKNGDSTKAEKINAHIEGIASELSSDASSADEEGKKKLGVAAKIGIAAGAAALLALGLTGAGQGLKANLNKKNKTPGSLANLIIHTSNKLLNLVDRFGKNAKGRREGRNEWNAANPVKKEPSDPKERFLHRMRKAGDGGRVSLKGIFKKDTESFDELDFSDPRYMSTLLAMEEANFSDEVSLADIDEEEGRSFDSFDDVDEELEGCDECEEDEEESLESMISDILDEDE